MKPPPILEDEDERLSALEDLDILDTPSEYRFDRITRMAARSIGVKYSEINLIDQDREWTKSQFGTHSLEAPRKDSFCAHVIADDEVMVVPDARKDERFQGNPKVEDFPHIRFYMAIPIQASAEHNVGTLCVYDDEPRSPSSEDVQMLVDLGSWVSEELERELGLTAKIQTLKKSRQALFREIHHRVRNNLQIILALINLERKYYPEVTLSDRHQILQGRLQTLAIMHEHLPPEEEDLWVPVDAYLEDLVSQMLQTYKPPRSVEIETESASVTLDVDQAPAFGLIVHELVLNALKHAFPEKKGTIDVEVHEEVSGQIKLAVRDDGKGLPEDFDWTETDSTGLKLVRWLGQEQLNGSLAVERERGTEFTLAFMPAEPGT